MQILEVYNKNKHPLASGMNVPKVELSVKHINQR